MNERRWRLVELAQLAGITDSSLEHALAHLSRRDEQVHHLSLRRLQASAELHAYLASYYSLE